MTELKLSEICGLLPNKKESSPYSSNPEICFENPGYNKAIDDLSTKNLLDYVEAVLCPCCVNEGPSCDCPMCNGTGAIIRVKEGK